MPIDRANVGVHQRLVRSERLLAQHHADLQRVLRRLGELAGPTLPENAPGAGGGEEPDGAVLWGTTDRPVQRDTSGVLVAITIGATGVRSAIEAGIMKTGDTLATGALVKIEKQAGLWRITNADCDQIS